LVSGTIEIECDLFEIPNYFSPNSDGINDIWLPEGLSCYPDFEAQIFDRQGRILYQIKGENSEG
jgi:gliding motility-associated-like protein